MPNPHLQRIQKAGSKEKSKLFKRSFSYIASYLTKSKQKQSTNQTTEPQRSRILTAVELDSEAGRPPGFIRRNPKIREYTKTMELFISASQPEAFRHSIHPHTKTTISCSHAQESDTDTQSNTLQPTDSSPSNTACAGKRELYSGETSTTISDDQKRDAQYRFIKSLIRKVVTERREEKPRFRSSRRMRYLTAVRGVMRGGWGGRLQTLGKSRQGRKRKLE